MSSQSVSVSSGAMNESATDSSVADNPVVSDVGVPDQRGLFFQALAAVRQYATVAQLLRMGGAAGVVAAMSLFLLQGIEVSNDLQRFLTLLGQTVVLTAGGLLVSYLFKDNKGARVFFGLGLVSVPVNFAVLGAMLYTLVPLDVQSVVYPPMMGWHIAGFGSMGIAALVAAAVLIPVTYFGFAVMARPNTRLLGTLCLASSAILLVPVRETVWVTLIAFASGCALLWLLHRFTVEHARLKTLEGWFARALLFVPPLLMVSRSIVLYSVDIYSMLVFSIMFYSVLRYSVTQLDAKSLLCKIAHIAAVPVAFATANLVVAATVPGIEHAYYSAVLCLVFAAMMLELNRGIHDKATGGAVVFISGSLLLAVACVYAFFGMMDDYGFNLVFSGCVTMAVAVYAWINQHRLLAGIAAVLLVPHAIRHGEALWALTDFGNWMTVAVLGISAILAASLLERYGAVLIASRKRHDDADADGSTQEAYAETKLDQAA